MSDEDRVMQETRDEISKALDLLGAESSESPAGAAILRALAATDPQRRRVYLREALTALPEGDGTAAARVLLEDALDELAALRA
ncbi:MAG: hypothetical protein WAU32_05850 [Thermoanaerobaculia bacterium]